MTEFYVRSNRKLPMHKKKEPKSESPAAFLKPDEGHAIIGKDKISRRSFYNALNRNEIPNIRIGSRILIPRHAFERWLAASGGQAA
jgi:excisionase family DNA binding protein